MYLVFPIFLVPDLHNLFDYSQNYFKFFELMKYFEDET